MDKSLLVRIVGFPATLIHHDLLVLDRWRYLRQRLPITRNGETLIDVGCGTGAFTIGAALRGYCSVGLSWNERNQHVAKERAGLCKVPDVEFPIQDVRHLDQRHDFHGKFDVAISCENIEHVLDDRKLMRDMVACLAPGGRLLLTTPNYFYRAMTPPDNGPFSRTEDGEHVRRGYSAGMLRELCADSGLLVEEITFCSGFFSQKVTALMRVMGHGLFAWALALPLRILPILFDPLIAKVTGWPGFSICVMAVKPRYPKD